LIDWFLAFFDKERANLSRLRASSAFAKRTEKKLTAIMTSALTTRFLNVENNNDDENSLGWNHEGLFLPTNLLGTTRATTTTENDELINLVSPCNSNASSSKDAMASSFFGSNNNNNADALAMPTTAAAAARKGNSSGACDLFASFSSSLPSEFNMWHYSENQIFSPLAAPTGGGLQDNNNKTAEWASPMVSVGAAAPGLSLQLQDQHGCSDRLPTVIRCRAYSNAGTVVTSVSSASAMGVGDDDDEVSLLADDPDEDDEGVLPPSTYDVLANIFDDIDKDDDEENSSDDIAE
jgi:hypothetical protein